MCVRDPSGIYRRAGRADLTAKLRGKIADVTEILRCLESIATGNNNLGIFKIHHTALIKFDGLKQVRFRLGRDKKFRKNLPLAGLVLRQLFKHPRADGTDLRAGIRAENGRH